MPRSAVKPASEERSATGKRARTRRLVLRAALACVAEQELTVAPESREVPAGRLEAGSVSGQRYRWLGLRGGSSRIEMEALWTLGGFHPEHWPKPRDGWTVSIEGDPSLQVHFLSMASFGRREATMDDHVQAASVATAMQAVNSIPALCEAEPGWWSSADLGLVGTGIGFRHPRG